MRLNRPLLAAATAAVAVMTLATACSSDDASPPDVTTGTVDRSTTTTTTTEPDAADRGTGGDEDDPLVGLWLAVPVGITDEEGTVYAKSRAGETLRSPLDDGLGGVYFLRCTDGEPNCAIEHSTSPDEVPAVLGEASNLLALGTSDAAPVLLTSWMDPTLTPSFETDVSGLVAQVIDLETGRVVSSLPQWFGWESGPFAADVENDVGVVCFGEGESCALNVLAGIAGAPAPIAGVDLSTVMSLALDPTGQRLTWVESLPMDGAVTLHTAMLTPSDLTARDITAIPLSEEGRPSPDDAVTDGAWVALRSGIDVTVHEVAGQQREGTLKVAPEVTEMALRTLGSGGSASSSL